MTSVARGIGAPRRWSDLATLRKSVSMRGELVSQLLRDDRSLSVLRLRLRRAA